MAHIGKGGMWKTGRCTIELSFVHHYLFSIVLVTMHFTFRMVRFRLDLRFVCH